MHRIHDHREAQAFQALGQGSRIYLGLEPRHIGAHRIEALGRAGDRHRDPASLQAGFHALGEVALHRAAEGPLDLEAEPFGWVVAGGDHQRPQGTALHHGPTGGRRGGGAVGQHRLQIGAAHRSADRLGQFGSQETAVVADHHLAAGESCGGGVGQLGCGSRRHWQQPLHRDVHPEDAPPSIGAEGDRAGLQRQRGGSHRGRGWGWARS